MNRDYDFNTGCEQSLSYEQQSFHPAHPPIPEGGLVRAKDDLWDRDWFRAVVWTGGIVAFLIVGNILNEVLR